MFIVLFFIGCSSKQPPVPPPQTLPVIRVGVGSGTTYLQYPASIAGTVNVEIRPQVSGTLDRVFIEEGAYVRAGDPLFKINEAPYREKLNNAIATLHAAEGGLVNAELEVEKLTPLVDNKVVSDYQIRTARAASQVAAANVEQAKADIAAAQINIGYTLIRASVSGYIGLLPKKQGSLVSPGDPTPMTELSDVHEVHVYFALGEYDFIRFKSEYPGKTLAEKIKQLPEVELILADDSAYSLKGRIDLIDGQFDKNTGAITVRATFVNRDGLLRAGNTGKIKLGLPFAGQVIVPQSATLEIQDQVFVFQVGDSDRVSRQPIRISGKIGTNYLVNGGIKSGDRIVFNGFDHLREGEIITPGMQKTDTTNIVATN